VIFFVFIFTKVLFTAVILPNFCYPNKNIFFVDYFLAKILVGSFAETCLLSAPSAGSAKG